MNEVGRPDCPVDAVGAAARTALGPWLGLGIRIRALGDVDGDEGIGVAPPQQAENVLRIGLDVALYLRLVLDVGASHHRRSQAGNQEAVAQPCSSGLGAVKTTKSAK